MWKCHNFSVTQILREIKVGEFGASKITIVTHLEAMNIEILQIFPLSEAPKMAKWQF